MSVVAAPSGLVCPPAVLHVPDGAVGTFGDDVAEVAAAIGREPVPEQKAAIDALVAHDRRGRFLSVEAAVEGPRQTVGKTGAILLPIILWTALTDPDDITWTAHLAETALNVFQELAGRTPDDEDSIYGRYSWFRRRVRSISYENGSEGIRFANGASIAFRVRSKMRGRGLSGNTVVNDEYLFVRSEQIGAQLPVLATRSMWGNARAYAASSAALAESGEQRRLRARALAGDQTLTFVGWWAAGGWDKPGCAGERCSHEPGTEGCVLDDRALWRSCNPLLGRLVSEEFLAGMRSTMKPLEFGREFAGWQEEPAEGLLPLPFSVADWKAVSDAGVPRPDRPGALAVDVSPGLRSAAVAAATRLPDGRRHLSLVERRFGAGWVVGLLEDLATRYGLARVVALNPKGAAGSLILDLQKARWEVRALSLRDATAAAGALHLGVRDGTVVHVGDPMLEEAVRAARRHEVGSGADKAWTFTRAAGESGDICPIVAVTEAAWLLEVQESSPQVVPMVEFR